MASPIMWSDAYEITYHAMGTRRDKNGRLWKTYHLADGDPLAAHCLAEWIWRRRTGRTIFPR